MQQIDQDTTASSDNRTKPVLGVLEWFRPGEHERVEQAIEDMRRIGITELRTGWSWADYHDEGGPDWYDWLIPLLAKHVNILPCFTYTPPSLGVEPKTSSPPRNPKDYADFIDVIITRFGRHFEWVELWNEPNNLNDWDWRLDKQWHIFSEMAISAAFWAHERGKKTVLGGMCPTDANWIDLMCRNGVIDHIDAVGIHGFPGTWEYDWSAWEDNVDKVRNVLEWHESDAEIWITEGGFSTWDHDEHRQLREFVGFMDAPVDRAYWYSLHDLHPEQQHQDGFHRDERHYHFGLLQHDFQPKLLYRIWEEYGLEGVRALAEEHGVDDGEPSEKEPPVKINGAVTNEPARALITGGAGFIGTNLANRLLTNGQRVRVIDNLSRPGVERNLKWLRDTHGDAVDVVIGDIRNPYRVRDAARDIDNVYHFAAQVAVTTSVDNPAHDFETNLRGTFNLLEAVRAQETPPTLLFTSTNKVYGGLEDIILEEQASQYAPVDPNILRNGIGSDYPLSFHSPYGCSKGAADQYVLDYARIYGVKTAVFRMSCIYGPHQFGTEDQGWVAHFLISALQGQPITLYGDGKQVRDILFVDDLIDAMQLAVGRIDDISGSAFNIGGGPANAVSLIGLIDIMNAYIDGTVETTFDEWRPGDQRYYVSDIRDFMAATGWKPRVSVADGVEALHDWLVADLGIASRALVA